MRLARPFLGRGADDGRAFTPAGAAGFEIRTALRDPKPPGLASGQLSRRQKVACSFIHVASDHVLPDSRRDPRATKARSVDPELRRSTWTENTLRRVIK